MVATETESKTASTATPANFSLSCSGIPSLSKASNISGSTSSKEFGFFSEETGAA